MLLSSILSSVCLSLLFANAPQPVEGRHAILPRQDGPSSTLANPRDPSIPTSSLDAESARESQEASRPITSPTTPESDTKSTLTTSRSTASATGTPKLDDNASSTPSDSAVLTATPIANSSLIPSSSVANDRTEELPITPRITPALSVAGAFLMLTGLFYTLIGIKTKWLHVFLSTAYLTSLATTVLIVYVMHPPVSNAVQGAYFVAAFVTGIIFGGGSVVFTDVTEGLGCLLGGYCLAMWFLVLTPGGLIKSTAGKIIFIACFTLGAFGCYLSHWTRAYGLIGAISFAGATIIVLGIDCFSRAGLKEFWLYIWDLNENVFPLHYRGPYPMTRGIRVEIAAIIIIFLVGVMSQMKIWKIIRRRREERAAQLLKREQLQAQADEDLGRRVEEGNNRDRTLWEAAYGGKDRTNRHIDSGIGTEAPSVGKASLSIVGTNGVTGSRPQSIEMNDLEGGTMSIEHGSSLDGKGKARATVTIRVASDDDVVQSNSARASTGDDADPAHFATDAQFSQAKDSPSLMGSGDTVRPQEGKRKKSLGPEVVGLPFHVPEQDPSSDRRSSIAASIASEHFSTRVLKRLSGSPLKRTSSKKSQRSYIVTSTSEEALMIPQGDEDDRASSIEANVDDISDGNRSDGSRSEVDGTTLAGLPSPAAEELLKFSPPTEPHPVERPDRKISKMSLDRRSSKSAPLQDEVQTGEPSSEKPQATTDSASADVNHNPHFQTPPNHETEAGQPANNAPQAGISTGPEQVPQRPALRDSLADLQTSSKVAMTYRTNEWAKHLDRAEKPSLDDLRSIRRAESSKSHDAPTTAAENAAPVDISALQQTPLNAVIPPPTTSQTSLDSLPSQQRTPTRRTSPPSHLQQQQKRTSHHHQNNNNNTSPLTSTPTIAEDRPSTFIPHSAAAAAAASSSPLLPTTNTLISRRESMLQTRASSTFLPYFPSNNNNNNNNNNNPRTRTPSSSSPPNNNNNNIILTQNNDDDDENLPLSHRRVSLQRQQQQQQQQQQRSSSGGAGGGGYPFPPTPITTATIKQDPPSQPPNHHLTSLLQQKRRSEHDAQRAKVAKRRSEGERDARWRESGGGMEERHREAMRRMQREAVVVGVGEKQ